jgi:PAS domain S-box-containing protein
VPVVVNDVSEAEDFLPNPLLPDTRSELALPMILGQDVLGVFDVQHDVIHWFNQARVDVLFTLAGQIATALQNARFVERIEASLAEQKQAEQDRQRFVVQLRTAAEIAEQVGAILEPDRLLEAVIPLLKERFDLYHAHVYTLEGQDLVLKSGYGRIGRIMVQQGHRIPLDHPHSLVAKAARSREPVVVNDVQQSEDFLPNVLLPHTRAEVAVPIAVRSTVLGVFDVQADRVESFSSSDVDAFRTLAGQLANALYGATLIEQQKQTQAELRSSAAKIRAIFDAMTEGLLVTDVMGRIVDANEAALSLHGYGARDELLGRSAMELVTRSGWSRLGENTRQLLETGETDVFRCTMLRRDGSTFDAEQSTALLLDSEGEPQGMVTITRDVTQREADRREILRFKALAENAVDAIIMADLSGEVEYVNPAGIRLFGFDERTGDIVGTPLTELWSPDDLEVLVDQALPAAGATGWQGEVKQVRADGTLFEAALTFFSVKGERDAPISLAAIVRDITERKQAERELRDFTLQLQTAADVSAQVSAILDPTSLLEAVVPLVQQRFGLYHLHVYELSQEGKVLIMRVGSGEAGRAMREHGHQIALDRHPSLVAKAARTQEIVLVDDVRQDPAFMPNPLLPDTRTEIAIPMLVGDQVVGVFDVQDRVAGRFSVSEVAVFSTLATQVGISLRNAQYFEELQTVARRLREVDRLKSEFLANMSHELRTPLNSILGYAEVLLMGIDGELTPEMDEDVRAIFENGHQLLQLINDILDLTKIEAGRMSLSVEGVDVQSLLQQTKSHALGLLHRNPKPVEIRLFVDDDLPPIQADPIRLAQVLNNLVSNAVKFTDEGSVSLRAWHDRQAARLCIAVEDTGVGISESDLARLFERFHQVDGSSTRRAEGTGLGLAISKQLVEMHHGELTVESRVGMGSTFTVCLPEVSEERLQIADGQSELTVPAEEGSSR